jgi:hypothetical protein
VSNRCPNDSANASCASVSVTSFRASWTTVPDGSNACWIVRRCGLTRSPSASPLVLTITGFSVDRGSVRQRPSVHPPSPLWRRLPLDRRFGECQAPGLHHSECLTLITSTVTQPITSRPTSSCSAAVVMRKQMRHDGDRAASFDRGVLERCGYLHPGCGEKSDCERKWTYLGGARATAQGAALTACAAIRPLTKGKGRPNIPGPSVRFHLEPHFPMTLLGDFRPCRAYRTRVVVPPVAP